jgi:hypothetical protein
MAMYNIMAITDEKWTRQFRIYMYTYLYTQAHIEIIDV